MTTYRYVVRDRRYGEIFIRGEIDGASRTEARNALLAEARRDQPRDARNYGYVPLRDWQIIFTENTK